MTPLVNPQRVGAIPTRSFIKKANRRMFKDKVHCDSIQCRIFRLLFLFFLVVFTISPIIDAYADSLYSPPDVFDDQNDPSDPVVTRELILNDNRKCIDALKASKRASKDYKALLQRASMHDEPACHILTIQISTNDIESSHMYLPVSSDLSPPVV